MSPRYVTLDYYCSLCADRGSFMVDCEHPVEEIQQSSREAHFLRNPDCSGDLVFVNPWEKGLTRIKFGFENNKPIEVS